MVGVVLQGRGAWAGAGRAGRRGHLLLDFHGQGGVGLFAVSGAGLRAGILRLDRRAHRCITDLVRQFDVAKDLVNVRSRAAIVVTVTSKVAVHLVASLGGIKKSNKSITQPSECKWWEGVCIQLCLRVHAVPSP